MKGKRSNKIMTQIRGFHGMNIARSSAFPRTLISGCYTLHLYVAF